MEGSDTSPHKTPTSIPAVTMSTHVSVPQPNYRRVVRINAPPSCRSPMSPLPPIDYDLSELCDEQLTQSVDVRKRQRRVVLNITDEETSEVRTDH